MTEPLRLAKRVAELRACSRREAELLITGGWVQVDGQVIETPQFRVADQQIEIDPRADPGNTEPVTLLLHKTPGQPAGKTDLPASTEFGTATQWEADTSGIRPLKMHFTRLTACTPLETDASGLLVFTQDWKVARKLIDDAASLEHEVVVEVTGELGPHGLKQLNQGLAGQGRAPAAIRVSWQNESHLRFALKGAHIGQIARLCEAVGLQVVSMKRIRLGGVPLGKVPPGQWRYLLPGERF